MCAGRWPWRPSCVEQRLGLAVRRAGVARGQDRAEAVAALGVGLDPAAQVVLRLAGVEERVAALGVGVPDVDDRAGDRLAVHVADLALHDQDLAGLAAVVEPGLGLRERRAGDVERALDGAGRAALDAGLALGLVHAQVEEGLDAEAGDQQAGLVGLAEPGDVGDAGPELVGLDVEVLDGAEHVLRHAADDRLDAGVARGRADAGDAVEQRLHVGVVDEGFGHWCFLRCSAARAGSGWQERSPLGLTRGRRPTPAG